MQIPSGASRQNHSTESEPAGGSTRVARACDLNPSRARQTLNGHAHACSLILTTLHTWSAQFSPLPAFDAHMGTHVATGWDMHVQPPPARAGLRLDLNPRQLAGVTISGWSVL
jgi:hypothetical protein